MTTASVRAEAWRGRRLGGRGWMKRMRGTVEEATASTVGPQDRCEEGGRERGGSRVVPVQMRRSEVEVRKARREPQGEKVSAVTADEGLIEGMGGGDGVDDEDERPSGRFDSKQLRMGCWCRREHVDRDPRADSHVIGISG